MTDFVFDPIAPADEELPDSTDGVYTLNESHVAEAISHLIDFFRSGPRNQAELDAYVSQTQELENVAWEMHHAFDVDTATGHQLTLLGKRVGEPRLGRGDDAYRAGVRVRIMVNRANGKAEELIAIARAMLPLETYPDVTVTLDEAFPRTITVYLDGDLGDVTIDSVARLLRLAKGATKRLNVVHGLDDEDGFAARWALVDEVDLDTGWGVDTDDSHAGTGGSWAEVV